MCVTLTLCVFSKIFFKNFSQNFSNIFFKNFCQNFFQNCDTRLLQWYLWSLGLVAANSRLRLCTCPLCLWAWQPQIRGYMLLSLSMCVTLTLCVYSKIFFKNIFQNFSNIFFKNFCQNFFHNCDTRLLQWYLWSLGSVAANSRLRLCTDPLRLWAW